MAHSGYEDIACLSYTDVLLISGLIQGMIGYLDIVVIVLVEVFCYCLMVADSIFAWFSQSSVTKGLMPRPAIVT